MKILLIPVTVLFLLFFAVSYAIADSKSYLLEQACTDEEQAELCKCRFDGMFKLLTDEQIGLIQIALESAKSQKSMSPVQRKQVQEEFERQYADLMQQIEIILEANKDAINQQCEASLK